MTSFAVPPQLHGLTTWSRLRHLSGSPPTARSPSIQHLRAGSPISSPSTSTLFRQHKSGTWVIPVGNPSRNHGTSRGRKAIAALEAPKTGETKTKAEEKLHSKSRMNPRPKPNDTKRWAHVDLDIDPTVNSTIRKSPPRISRASSVASKDKNKAIFRSTSAKTESEFSRQSQGQGQGLPLQRARNPTISIARVSLSPTKSPPTVSSRASEAITAAKKRKRVEKSKTKSEGSFPQYQNSAKSHEPDSQGKGKEEHEALPVVEETVPVPTLTLKREIRIGEASRKGAKPVEVDSAKQEMEIDDMFNDLDVVVSPKRRKLPLHSAAYGSKSSRPLFPDARRSISHNSVRVGWHLQRQQENQKQNSQSEKYEGSETGLMSASETKDGPSIVAYEVDLPEKDKAKKPNAIVTCAVCGMLYSPLDTHDSKQHSRYHSQYVNGIEWIPRQQWRRSQPGKGIEPPGQVGSMLAGGSRIVKVTPHSSAAMIAKSREVLSLVRSVLGSPDPDIAGSGKGAASETVSSPAKSRSSQSLIDASDGESDVFEEKEKDKEHVFLYLSPDNRVVGCVVAHPLSSAKLLIVRDDNDNSVIGSENNIECTLGIASMWVHAKHRRSGICTALIDTVRQHYYYGHAIPRHRIAFSQPTPDGRKFATEYSGTHRFLVF